MTMQTPVVCPHCQDAVGHPIESTNQLALVDYFRCARCGHVWTEPKPGQHGQRHDITTYKIDPQPLQDL